MTFFFKKKETKMTTTNFELIDLARDRHMPDPICLYTEDLKHYSPKPGSYYVNIAHQHWTLVKIFRNGTCFFFNSFGTSVPLQVMRFLAPLKTEVAYNSNKIQDDKSQHCGLFVLQCDYATGQKCRTEHGCGCKENMENFQKYCTSFDANTKLNDADILRRIRASAHHPLPLLKC
jgi:hypothetical protein